MPFSNCCGAHTNYPEINICPDCLDHCDWEEEDEDDILEDIKTENEIEQQQLNNQQKP